MYSRPIFFLDLSCGVTGCHPARGILHSCIPHIDMFGTTKSGGKAKVRGHKRHLGGAVPEAKRRKQTNTGRAGGKKGEQSRGGKASAAAISPGGTRGKKPRNMVSSSRKFEGKKRKQTLKQFKNRRTATHT